MPVKLTINLAHVCLASRLQWNKCWSFSIEHVLAQLLVSKYFAYQRTFIYPSRTNYGGWQRGFPWLVIAPKIITLLRDRTRIRHGMSDLLLRAWFIPALDFRDRWSVFDVLCETTWCATTYVFSVMRDGLQKKGQKIPAPPPPPSLPPSLW